MGTFVVFLLIVMTVIVDFLWLDVQRKRWGWMNSWTKLYKSLFFSGFIAVSIIIYLGMSLN